MPSNFEEHVVGLLEFQQQNFFGKYRGVVSTLSDEAHPCQIKARVPTVLADKESGWAMPSLPFAGAKHGLVLLPEVGDGVWIEFEAGQLARPIWSGFYFADDKLPSPAGTKPENGEKVRLLATSAGNQILVDDDADEIKLVHHGGAQITMSGTEITLTIGSCELKITKEEINLNKGMVKVTTAGASLVNDMMKFGR